jgi:hypothetical protein
LEPGLNWAGLLFSRALSADAIGFDPSYLRQASIAERDFVTVTDIGQFCYIPRCNLLLHLHY